MYVACTYGCMYVHNQGKARGWNRADACAGGRSRASSLLLGGFVVAARHRRLCFSGPRATGEPRGEGPGWGRVQCGVLGKLAAAKAGETTLGAGWWESLNCGSGCLPCLPCWPACLPAGWLAGCPAAPLRPRLPTHNQPAQPTDGQPARRPASDDAVGVAVAATAVATPAHPRRAANSGPSPLAPSLLLLPASCLLPPASLARAC